MSSADFPFPVTFRRSTRAKRLRVTVRPDTVVCVLPIGCAELRAVAFIEQHRDWLRERFEAASARLRERSFWSDVQPGQDFTIPFRGRDTPLLVLRSRGKRPSLTVGEGHFELRLPDAERIEFARLAEGTLFRWAGSWMRDQLGPLLEHHQHSMSVQSRAVRIKRMQTRWGSCGGNNDINLNWLLSFAPAAVLEYVLVHELCHIRHRDHSPSFWAMVREHCPGYAGERAWLKEHGAGLIARFGDIR